MNGFIFLSNNQTMPECFDRMLFGSTWKICEKIFEIRKGCLCFLYNYDSSKLDGTFKARGSGMINIEPAAWGGRYPYQVRVEIDKANLLFIKNL